MRTIARRRSGAARRKRLCVRAQRASRPALGEHVAEAIARVVFAERWDHNQLRHSTGQPDGNLGRITSRRSQHGARNLQLAGTAQTALSDMLERKQTLVVRAMTAAPQQRIVDRAPPVVPPESPSSNAQSAERAGSAAHARTRASDAIWITWEVQPRNGSMARELGVPLHVLEFRGGRVRRQIRAIAATIRLLRKTRPRVVFAPNPSLVLTYLLIVCRALFRFQFVSDAHYGGVVDVTGRRVVQRLLNFAHRHVDLVIVTNPGHAERVRSHGGKVFVCPDPLPQPPRNLPRPDGMKGVQKSVLFICSYDADEPYREVFAAADSLSALGFRVFASGRYARVGISPESFPGVVLLGFVDRNTYDAYLHNVDLVLDLTTWQDCLVCGAYEAMAAGKPCVLSGTKALTELFTHGTVFCSHDPGDIMQAVLAAYEHRATLKAEIEAWADQHRDLTQARVAALRAAVGLPLPARS